ncbi:Phosphorylated CTD-interacting factor 1 [Takifugu flavidus]|uniref:Phosphorylated CTD-interacting factor 1 n=2 Tax=Takifugu flavidus TaxID=433684 RepID=A0A5C6N502_9TELE|nr:Phosphorylated CTD-interacting factor 1 [Takifugu flavidus]
MYYRAVHGTAVLFLQNEAGFSKWTPTPERVAELSAAYRPSSHPPSLSSPGPAHVAPGDRDSAAKVGERPLVAPSSHDNNNNNNNNSSSSVRDKMTPV